MPSNWKAWWSSNGCNDVPKIHLLNVILLCFSQLFLLYFLYIMLCFAFVGKLESYDKKRKKSKLKGSARKPQMLITQQSLMLRKNIEAPKYFCSMQPLSFILRNCKGSIIIFLVFKSADRGLVVLNSQPSFPFSLNQACHCSSNGLQGNFHRAQHILEDEKITGDVVQKIWVQFQTENTKKMSLLPSIVGE